MGYNVAPLQKLIEQFERLPGIGKKTAQRLAFFVLNLPLDQARGFADAILQAHEKIKYCAVCQNLTESDLCPVCSDGRRDKGVICVVEEPRDVIAFERTRDFDGAYHILHGAISPMEGIGVEQLRIKELLTRLDPEDIREVIMATNPTVEGEATAMYLSKLIKPFGIKVTRLAYGIPVGSDIEYADQVTLGRALEGRNEM